MSGATIAQRLSAEALGTAFLLAAVVGPGAMAERLAGGNAALALLCNTLPTGAILAVLTLMLGPVSGAHFVAQLIGAGAAVVAARDRLSGRSRSVRRKRRRSHACDDRHCEPARKRV